MTSETIINVVVTGEPGCGKTSIIYKFLNLVCSEYQVLSDFIIASLQFGQLTVIFYIYDLSDNAESTFTNIYGKADVIILCFTNGNREALERIESKWLLDVKYYCHSRVQILLVSTKTDLRESPRVVYMNESTLENCGLVNWGIKATQYIQCSALNGEGITKIFKAAVALHLEANNRSTKCCTLM